MKTFFTGLLCLNFYMIQAQRILAEHHFEGGDITSVTVDGAFCDVYVSRGTEKVIFDGVITGEGEKDDYIIASIRNGNTVLFTVERKDRNRWNWNSTNRSRIDLELPDGVNLTVDNSSGDVRIAEYSGKDLMVSTTSGDVTLKGIVGDCDLRTTSGDLIGRDITGTIFMRSTSGDQEFFGTEGALNTEATSGDIRIVQHAGYLEVQTTSGDMELDEAKGAFNLRSTSGNIEGRYLQITGDSRLKSTSGSIDLEFKNDIDDLGFDLRSSSGDLRVGRNSANDRLKMERGEYKITGQSTSGDQSYSN